MPCPEAGLATDGASEAPRFSGEPTMSWPSSSSFQYVTPSVTTKRNKESFAPLVGAGARPVHGIEDVRQAGPGQFLVQGGLGRRENFVEGRLDAMAHRARLV